MMAGQDQTAWTWIRAARLEDQQARQPGTKQAKDISKTIYERQEKTPLRGNAGGGFKGYEI